jgi:tetratricopeptide (TPR) repeat protein
LAQAEAGKRSLAERASSHFREGHFEQAIALYEQYIAAEGGLSKLSDVQFVELSTAQYSLSRVADAAVTYEAALRATRSKELRVTLRYHLASCRLLMGQPAEAIALLEDVIEHGRDYRLQAKHALSTAYIGLSPVTHAEEILRICQEVLGEVKHDDELRPEDVAELTAASYINMTQVLRAINQRDDARAAIMAAMEAIDDRRFPGLAATVIGWVDDREMRSSLLRKAITLIVDSQRELSSLPNAFELKLEGLGRLLNAAYQGGEQDLFAALLPFAVRATGETGFQALWTLASATSLEQQTTPARNGLLKYALTEPSVAAPASPRNRVDAARLWLENSSEPENSEGFGFFAREINANPTLLQESDILLLIGRLGPLLRFGFHRLALELADFVSEHRDYFLRETAALYALYLQHETTLHDELKELWKAHACAREILRLTSASSLRTIDVPHSVVAVIPRVRSAAQAMLQKKQSDPLIGIGRNDLVVVQDPATGVRTTSKFKKVADELRSGELIFLERARRP